MYSVAAYGRMITDELRTKAYTSALEQAIKPGCVVIDLGCGPGLFALLACKLGARRVYAIEPDDVIQVARESARFNDLMDRVVFIQDKSTSVKLPEKADVIVADLRGILPLFGSNLPSIQDARKRFLADRGVLIPARDHLWAVVVNAPETYDKLEAPWLTREGISLEPARKLVVNTWSKGQLKETDSLSPPALWHSIDYYNITNFDVDSRLCLRISKSGTAHGFAVWFDSDVGEGVSLSNAPGNGQLIYGTAFFPLECPLEVKVGDKVELRIRADFIDDEYMWSWETALYELDKPDTPKAHFKQSTLLGTPISKGNLLKRSNAFTPTLSDDGLITSFILSLIDGRSSNGQLAQRVADQFPERFSSYLDALDVVARVSSKFSK